MEVRRKHRWLFSTLAEFSREALLVLQKAQRPTVKFEEPEMHHNQEVVRFAGKHSWEPISLTWYDSEQNPDVSLAIWQWCKSVCDFTTANVAPPRSYKKQGQIQMLDGMGSPTEKWTLCNCWPKESNWGDIDYTATDIETIEVTMRFDRAQRM